MLKAKARGRPGCAARARFWRALCFLSSLICAHAQTLPLPPRPANALAGSQVAAAVSSLPLDQREAALRAQVLAGNVPEFLRRLCPVHVTASGKGQTNAVTFFATPDYLAVGSDADYFLVPLSPAAAQQIADGLGCSLPTRKMVDAIYAAAEVKLAPSPIPPSPGMTSITTFSNHNAVIREQRGRELSRHPLGALTAGHKKDVVISPKLAAAPGKVAIYGWHQTNGMPIQPLYLGHSAAWVDYSQCVRLVRQTVIVNGQKRNLTGVLADSELWPLLSDEGPVGNPRYEQPAGPAGPAPDDARSPPTFGTGGPQPPVAWEPGPAFGERLARLTLEPGIRILVNAPAVHSFDPAKKVLLIFYALPNGNTIEQTAGRIVQPGDDWHYDIQHIAAQTRFLRDKLPDRTIVVAYLESSTRSWPAWRKLYGDKLIPRVLDRVKSMFAEFPVELVLSGHSGGGSLLFGYLNTQDKLPNDLVRLSFLDSDYAYAREAGHAQKLASWLGSGGNHFLCVLAYNDSVALLAGKPVASPEGGTWGRSHQLQKDLGEFMTFKAGTKANLETFIALDGRVQFSLRQNPEKKIWHTVLVERNGFIHSMLSGTTSENSGYHYLGLRAYTNWLAAQ